MTWFADLFGSMTIRSASRKRFTRRYAEVHTDTSRGKGSITTRSCAAGAIPGAGNQRGDFYNFLDVRPLPE